MTRARALRGTTGLLAAFAAVEVVATVVVSVIHHWTWTDAVEAFSVTNGVMGLAFAGCGGIIAWPRPRNPIGWLFLIAGVAHATTALAAPLGAWLVELAAPLPAIRIVETLFAWAWPWSIGLCLPLALLLFPDGRPPSPRWRPIVIAVAVTAPLFPLEMGSGADPTEPGVPRGYLILENYAALDPLWTAVEIRGLIVLVIGLAALIVRYRRGSETERQQLLWLLLAVVITLGALLPWGLVTGTPQLVLLAIPLIPIAITVAVVRYQLLDIRLVISRVLAWVVMSLAVIVAYAGLVALLDQLISARIGRSALVTVLLVLVAAPLLPRLQRLVTRAMYGNRDDPVRLVGQVGAQLAQPDSGLTTVAQSVRDALRLPYAAITRGELIVAAAGRPPTDRHAVPLTYAGDQIGELRLGLRPGERRLGTADARAVDLLAVPLAAAVHSMIISAELQSSRERIVAAREEERRRLRRELHDGIGPSLTGIAFNADAAANLLAAQPERTAELLTNLRRDTRTAIADVRRLVDNLRPPALDEVGLIEALRQRADQLAWRSDGTPVAVRLDVPAELPPLSAAVEVASYRIATEALTNVVRHSRAEHAVVSVECSDRLEVRVSDDGLDPEAWRPGVGLQSMAERVAELGGWFSAGPTPAGGLVHAAFPLSAP